MRALAWLPLAALLFAAAPAFAAEAEQHFGTGIKLFQERNYSGALAEFEEAYRLKPTASALQNIALCLRALFRYTEAIDTLERMLSQHRATVEPEDERAARAAIDEMRAMVAVVTVRIEPPDATLTIDGKPLAGGAERRVRVNVGEHRFVAEAPRHRAHDSQVRLASGERVIEIRLESDVAELSVVADDAEAAIAVDGVPRSFGTWVGELSAGERHVVQVYRTGFTSTSTEVTLEAGERRSITVPLGPPTKDPNASTPFPYTPPPAAPARRGFYGLLTTTSYVLTPDPDGFKLPSSDSTEAAYFGLRLGYRFTNIFGLEGVAELGKHSVGPGCYTPPRAPDRCDQAPSDGASYELAARRFGASARFMTPGDRFRFLATSGAGIAHHALKLTAPAPQLQGSGSAFNAYLLLEAGVELSFGRALVGGVLAVAVDGITNLRLGPEQQRVYSDARNITTIGLGFRVGYAHW